MERKSTVTLDELDVKCLDELPIILNVLSSTANKLTRIYNPLFEKLLELLDTRKPSNWELSKDQYRGVFYPLTDDYRRDNITTLYAYFSLYYEVSLVPIGLPTSDAITIQMGLYYDAEDGELKRPCHFFELSREVRRKSIPSHSLSYYQAIKSKIGNGNLDVRIYHPEAGEKVEDITLMVYEHSAKAIQEAFDAFQREVLLPFLESMNVRGRNLE